MVASSALKTKYKTMKNWIKIFSKHSFMLCTLFFIALFSSCKKDSNPNNLPDADPSKYERVSSEGVIKILAIGNSFSEDALETNLYDLAKASGKTVIIGNLYIGGASLATHRNNAERTVPIYSYRKVSESGEKTTRANISLNLAVLDEKWDYISFQQASPSSGQLETVQADLPAVYNYVKTMASNPDVKYVYHQTWAYAQSSTYAPFENYDKDQLTMYNAIMNVSQKVKEIVPVDIIVPAGTAIQNARTSALGDIFNVADGYHLNNLGKYIAASTWFEAIFGQSVVGNTYKGGFSDFEVLVAQNAAHLATTKPHEISSMAAYEAQPIPLVNAVLVDFGNAVPSPSWNQMSGFTVGSKINLKDSLNVFVGMALTVTQRFNAINTDGAKVTNTPLNMPENVSSRSFYGNSRGALFNGITTPQGEIEISGLINTLTYNFSFFGSRAASDNRETKYTLTGANTGSANINPSSNSTAIATINNIQPNAEGKIILTVTSGAANLGANGWFYLNAARITSNNN